jgi:hypothetical protein
MEGESKAILDDRVDDGIEVDGIEAGSEFETAIGTTAGVSEIGTTAEGNF